MITGKIKCWGRGNNGRLGYGNENDISMPSAVGYVPVSNTDEQVIQIAAASGRTCLLFVSNNMHCWGYGPYGELGRSSSSSLASQGYLAVSNTNEKIIQIAAGYSHTCVLFISGNIKCFGDNREGQLGYGHENTVNTPATFGYIPVSNTNDKVVQISAASDTTCALFASGNVK